MGLWSFSVALVHLLLSYGSLPAASADAVMRPPGSLSFSQRNSLANLDYSSTSPSDSNWIGIYAASGGGPIKGQRVTDSLVWDWAPGEQGNLSLPTTTLTPGYRYKAFFLGGVSQYEQRADPIEFFLPGPGGDVHFLVDSTHLRNGRVGQDYRANVGGLLSNLPDHNFKFTKVSSKNGDWANISNIGEITGKPTDAGQTQITIEASNGSRSKSSISVIIKVVDEGTKLVNDLNVITFNLWNGGNNVDNFHEKQVRYINSAVADIIGLQESGDNQAATMIAQALGWYSLQYGDVGAVSKYPIVFVGPGSSRTLQIRIALDGDAQQIMLWNTHLNAYPYGPYEPCFNGNGVDAILATEKSSGRIDQITEIITAMADDLENAHKIPVLLTGDFNAPSHLDWIPNTGSLHCGVSSVSWPASTLLEQRGMTDSYREQHPDPLAYPGITWSPIFLNNPQYGNQIEPLDRIDFIYFRGDKLWTTQSNTIVVGNPKPEDPNTHRDNEWPSDHKAILTSFKLGV